MFIVGYREEQSVPFTLQYSRREIVEWTINDDNDNGAEYVQDYMLIMCAINIKGIEIVGEN